MTPLSLLNALRKMPADLPLVFRTGAGAIGEGYHVTELKLADVNSIDCGGRLASWTEAALQLLDGRGGNHMKLGKFNAILEQSIARVNGLGESPLQVEFAHENRGMRIYELAVPVLDDGVVSIRLSEVRANCKPALEHTLRADAPACCGSAASACCG